ncbi:MULTISPECIES: HK97-gp10 family putative phage morphogenesis protein [unclassified Moraxella]|uniref:HK97-gp10 family putative phage morphogenesis protein n=1 Tax=unclassified Moraxella TaxID=2685852 RepID=UPI00359DF75D
MKIEVKIDGLKELDEALAAFEDRIAKKALYSALSYAATPMMKDAKRRAIIAEKAHKMNYGRFSKKYVEVKPGLVRNAIKRRRLKKSELRKLGVNAGIAIHVGKDKKQKLYPNYWPFIEYGTVKQPAYPFFRPAFDANVMQAFQRFSFKLAQNIAKQQSLLESADDG